VVTTWTSSGNNNSMDLDAATVLFTKISSKWILDQNINAKT
jgi:hypothetical protein